MRAYSVGVRIAHVEKVVGVGRVCLGLKDVLGALCAADTHGESHAAHEDVHVVIRCKEAAGANVSVRQASVGFTTVLGIDHRFIIDARRLDGDGP